jgi:hypothetical protein
VRGGFDGSANFFRWVYLSRVCTADVVYGGPDGELYSGVELLRLTQDKD